MENNPKKLQAQSDADSPVAGREHINLASLTSALRALDPDGPDKIWAGSRVAPLARAAKHHPEIADQLWKLAVDWSSGKLRGKRSTTWSSDGAHGKRRQVRLHFLWQHYQSPKAGRHPNPATIRSIYFHAFQEGWTEESFK